MMAAPILKGNPLSMKTLERQLWKQNPTVMFVRTYIWLEMVGFCFLGLNISIFGSLMRGNPYTQDFIQKQTMWLVKRAIKFLVGFSVPRNQLSHTDPTDLEETASFLFGLVWFLCFNGLSTLFRLFNAKAILLEEQYYLTHSWEDKGFHTFPKGICPKVNIIARLENELAYYDSVVHPFNHYTTRAPTSFLCYICFRLCGSAMRLMSHLRGHERKVADGGSMRLWETAVICKRLCSCNLSIYLSIDTDKPTFLY